MAGGSGIRKIMIYYFSFRETFIYHHIRETGRLLRLHHFGGSAYIQFFFFLINIKFESGEKERERGTEKQC